MVRSENAQITSALTIRTSLRLSTVEKQSNQGYLRMNNETFQGGKVENRIIKLENQPNREGRKIKS